MLIFRTTPLFCLVLDWTEGLLGHCHCPVTNMPNPKRLFSTNQTALFVCVPSEGVQSSLCLLPRPTHKPVWALIFNSAVPLGRALPALLGIPLTHINPPHTHTHSIRRDRPRWTLQLQIRVTCIYTCTLSAGLCSTRSCFLSRLLDKKHLSVSSGEPTQTFCCL